MSSNSNVAGRIVTAVHGVRKASDDPAFYAPMAAWLRAQFRSEAVVDLYTRHMHGDDPLNSSMRAVIFRAAARRVGRGLHVGSGVGFKHVETFGIGDGVFIGAQSYLQGRFDGTFEIGDHVWIGPQSYFDARDLVLEEYVGWGPGARVLGSADFDGDGKADLVACLAQCQLFLGKGDGTFTTGPVVGSVPGAFSLVVADFNNDGLPDFAVANRNSTEVTVFLNKK